MAQVLEIIGCALIVLGFVFIAFGFIGVFAFKSFNKTILSAVLIDSVGFVSIMLGICILKGLSFFTLKTMLLLAIGLIINPITTHIILRSAHLAGHREEVAEDGNSNY